MIKQEVYFEDVSVGMALPTMEKHPTTTQLFQFSAATWNPHRIHYDKDYAAVEGHPDVLVHGPLHGAFLAQFVTNWMGPLGRLKKIAFSNRGRAFPGERLLLKGKVLKTYTDNGEHLVVCEIWEEKESGEVTAPGSAVVALPTRT